MAVAPLAVFNLPNADWKLKKSSSSSSSVYLDSLMENPSNPAVPHHLLESRVYMKLGSNVSFAAEPGSLHFGGFEIGRCHHQALKLVNISADVSNVHIIPPQSEHFTISYEKADRCAPGLALAVDVQFVADEWRYYSDCIRVHGEGEETLLVPLHAYPVMHLLDFPSHVSLSDVLLGQSALYSLKLSCDCPVAFEFCIVCSPCHKDFTVSPISGVVPGGGLLEVTVTYTPSSYGTAQVRLELLTSEFNARRHVCVVTGSCAPLLAARTVQPPEQISPTGRPRGVQGPCHGVSRKRKHLRSLQHSASQVTEVQNLRFPTNLSNPHAVSTVLSQRPGKLRARDLRGGLSDKKVETRQEKETRFQELLQRSLAEEEANQLRWQVHLGCDPMSMNQCHIIMEGQWSAAPQAVSDSPDLSAEYRRASALAGRCRVLRHVDGPHRPPPPLFDPYVNDLWANRSRALRRFQQAGRTVVIRRRVDGRLTSLRKLLQRLLSDGSQTCGSSDEEMAPELTPPVLPCEFPPYPTEPGGSMADHLASILPKPVASPLRHQLSYHGLKVPQHWRAMAYEPERNHRGAAAISLSSHLARPLRSGAQDELMAEVTPQPPDPGAAPTQTWSAHSHREEECVVTQTLLRPPETLLSPPEFHPMHVFNAAPGLTAFRRLLPYGHVHLENHLCPMPMYPPQPEAAGGPARKGPIRGVLTWKKLPAASFPAALLVAGVRRRRGCDPLSVDLLPLSAPLALRSSAAEDQDSVVPRDGDGTESKVMLTPDMVTAEFTALQSSTPHDNLDTQEESPLDGNALADRLRGRLGRMKLLSREARLILE